MERDGEPALCPVCKNALGELEPGQREHKFCGWATPSDWAALRPYMDGSFTGVHMGGC